MGQNVLTNDFSWSKSRHEKFQDCRRAYYLHYYGSWGGWEDAAHPELRQLWVLKKLANRFNWAGNVVHAVIKDALLEVRAGRRPDAARAITRARFIMREDYKHSRTRAYWQERRRLEFMGLMEHEYGEPLPDSEWKRIWDSVEAALTWFFQSPWLERARALQAQQWLEVDEGADHSWFEMEGVKMFAIPDFAFRDDAGHITVVDWKTGVPHTGYEDQVVGYALYLAHRHRVEPHQIRCQLVFLNAGQEVEVPVDAQTVQHFSVKFRESVQRMRELLVNAAANTPLDAAQFPMTDELKQCARCAFRRACGREGVTFASLQPPGPQPVGPSASAA
ncbi:MAG: PD-(D/E)XK nuclease family protein [Myxococcaceae bacterium]